MPEETLHVAQLRFDPKNARTHPKQNLAVLEKSLQQTGAGRSILLASDGTILAGNATVEVAAQVGMENVRVVESDGTQLIAVRRTDLDSADPRAVQAALYDNYSSDLAEWDNQQLLEFQQVEAYELDQIFSAGFLNDLDQDQQFDFQDQTDHDQEDAQDRVKRWTLQFSQTQFQQVKTTLQQLVDAGMVTKTSENSDVFGNAVHFLVEQFGGRSE